MDNNGDDSEGQVDEEEPPGVAPGDVGEAMGDNQNDGQDEPAHEETPGVSDEEIDPETPGVGTREDDEASNDGNDPPTLGETTDQQPPGTETRYNLRSNRGRSYNHRYAGSDFIVEDENGVVMTMEGTGEVLETPQMSLKAGLCTFGSDGLKAVEKDNRSLLSSGGLMADVPCLGHSLDGCKGRPDDVQTTKHARRTHAWSRCARTSLGAHASLFGASGARFWIVMRATSARIEEPSMVSILYIKSSVPDTYK